MGTRFSQTALLANKKKIICKTAGNAKRETTSFNPRKEKLGSIMIIFFVSSRFLSTVRHHVDEPAWTANPNKKGR
eukprot:scaffold1936_cov154-Amphora_coffeaeformis.AAC.6